MLQPERIDQHLQSQRPEAAEIAMETVFSIPGGALRETWSY